MMHKTHPSPILSSEEDMRQLLDAVLVGTGRTLTSDKDDRIWKELQEEVVTRTGDVLEIYQQHSRIKDSIMP